MGFRVQLIVVENKEPILIHREYGVRSTGQCEEIPESPVLGARLPRGGYLLYINDEIVPDERMFARLSQHASLVACYANETVMNSYACGWANGVECWSIFHDAQQGINHLELAGTPPNDLGSIQERLFAQQAGSEDIDYVFDIPVDLFVALGGIRYDHDIPGADPEPWEILERL